MSNDFKTKLWSIVERMPPDSRAQVHKDMESVLQAGVSSYDDLLVVLQDRNADTHIRSMICWTLARLRDKRAVSVLLTLLKDESVDVRIAAAQALGLLASKKAVRPLIATMLGDKDSEVHMAAAYALGSLGDRRAVKPLISMLGNQSESPKVRGMVAEALADLKDSQAVAPLIAALQDASVEVRFWAVFALGKLGDPQALPELERLAATDEAILERWGAVNKEAIAAIQSIHDQMEADKCTKP